MVLMNLRCLQVKDQKQQKVVFIAKVIADERRGFLNAEEAAAALHEAFPGTYTYLLHSFCI